MRLLIVTQTLDKNDSNLGFFHSWVLGFSKKFETVKVIALNVGAHDLPPNVTVHTLGKELGMERIPRIMRYVALLVRFRREYTHVFVHMNPEYVLGGGLIWRLLGKKIGFWYVHGAVTARLKLAELFVHKIFTASVESCRIKSKKIAVVGHGIDTDVFTPGNTPHPPAVLSAGRLSPSKQLDVIIDALTLVKKEVPSLSASIVGAAGTPEEKEYAERITKKAKGVGISVLSPVTHAEVPHLLQGADIFLNASTTGSLDKAVLEAMSAGVVPVTSNPAFEYILKPLNLYTEVRAELFAKVVSMLLKNPQVKEKLAQRVREEVVQNHSFEKLMLTLHGAFGKM